MSSHSPSQASVCVCGEKMYWPFNGFCTRVGTGNASRYLLAHFHSTGGTDWAFSAPATVRDQGARPQLSARSCKRSLGNSRIRFAWGSDTRPHSPRAWTSGYSRNVCRISTSHLSTWCWWCVVVINWHSVAPREVCKYRVLIIAR